MSSNKSIIDVFSIENPINKYNLQMEKDTLWPLWSFNITIPMLVDSTLNILEEVVYELLLHKHQDKNEIAQLTGLDIDLIAFIISRFQQLNVVDKRLNIIDDSKVKEKKIRYEAATIFYDIATKTYLPFIIKNSPDLLRANKDKNKWKFEQGDSGSANIIYADCVVNNPASPPKITADDVSDIIRRAKKVNNSVRSLMQEGMSIELDNSPTLIYLHRKAFIPSKGGKVFIQDGLNGGVCPLSTRYFSRHVEWLDIKFKKSADKERLSSKNFNNVGGLQQAKEELIESYKQLKDNVIDSSSEERNLLSKQGMFFNRMYLLLENILYELYIKNSPVNMKSVYFEKLPETNGLHARSMAESLGFNVGNLTNYFFAIDKGNLSHVDSVEPEMSTMIAINLLSAKQKNTHPLNKLSNDATDLFEKIGTLKQYRNSENHGDNKFDLQSKENIKTWYDWFELVSAVLVGESYLNRMIEHVNEEKVNDQDNVDLKIVNIIDNEFNWYQKNQMNEQVLDIINSMARARVERNISNMIMHAASALQKSLYFASRNINEDSYSSEPDRNKMFKIIEEKMWKEKIPNNINKTNHKRTLKAISSIDSTLGANTLAFLYKVNVEDLKKCANHRMLMKSTSTLVTLRGHGRMLTEADITYQAAHELQTQVCKIINDLLENFNNG